MVMVMVLNSAYTGPLPRRRSEGCRVGRTVEFAQPGPRCGPLRAIARPDPISARGKVSGMADASCVSGETSALQRPEVSMVMR